LTSARQATKDDWRPETEGQTRQSNWVLRQDDTLSDRSALSCSFNLLSAADRKGRVRACPGAFDPPATGLSSWPAMSKVEWWRRRESNPRPRNSPKRCLQAQPSYFIPVRLLAATRLFFALPNAQRRAFGSASPMPSRCPASDGTVQPAGWSASVLAPPVSTRQTRCLIRQRVRVQSPHLIERSTGLTREMGPRPAAPSATNPVETLTPPPSCLPRAIGRPPARLLKI